MEGVVIVGSILLAFGIDAWWDGTQGAGGGGRIGASGSLAASGEADKSQEHRLQRDPPLVLQVIRQIDGRHPALTEFALYAVAAF